MVLDFGMQENLHLCLNIHNGGILQLNELEVPCQKI